jgi:hypothetical protein
MRVYRTASSVNLVCTPLREAAGESQSEATGYHVSVETPHGSVRIILRTIIAMADTAAAR